MDFSDLNLLRELEKGLPLVHRPYAEIGTRLSMTEDEVIRRIAVMKDTGIIRRFRARINQRRLGIVANALVAWKISKEESDNAGMKLAEIPGVTHCYRRCRIQGKWEYTLYTVHHGWSHEQVLHEVEIIAEKTGYSDYIVLFSTEEYKRTPHTRVEDLESGI